MADSVPGEVLVSGAAPVPAWWLNLSCLKQASSQVEQGQME